jgi:hypothetical protein
MSELRSAEARRLDDVMKQFKREQRGDGDNSSRQRPLRRSADGVPADECDSEETPRSKTRPGGRKSRNPLLVPGVITLAVVQSTLAIVGIAILIHRWTQISEPLAEAPVVRLPITPATPAKEPAKKPAPPTAAPPPPTPPAKDPLSVAGMHFDVVLPAHLQQTLGVAYSADGSRLATTSRDGVLRLWDVTGTEPGLLYEANEQVGPLASPTFSPDGRTFAVASLGRALIYDCSGPNLSRRFVLPECTVASESPFSEQVLGFFPDGEFIAVGFETREPTKARPRDTSLRTACNVWYAASPQPVITTAIRSLAGRYAVPGIPETKAHQGWAIVLGFTPDSQMFITRGQDHRVIWWQAATNGTKLREWQSPPGVELWRFTPDGRSAAFLIPQERVAILHLAAPFQLP